ncbi:protein of unknown function DUF602 [Kipferlia bialata]|uniref:Zinc finger, RING/FYVE/PHD-type n=1 Tax=Kipferlia bialata TaxID=797122 RepID=A0A9K3CLQ6_9EUKA|nr:protein of unknown function DUF602 [Kipferlia bialata]|eukprot:g205.t1
MGNDGCSMMTDRRFLVNVRQSGENALPIQDKESIRHARWCCCSLTGQALTKGPVVCDRLGSLFLRKALVAALLSKNLPSQYSHIKKSSDFLNIAPAPVTSTGKKGAKAAKAPQTLQCALSGEAMTGVQPFVVVDPCGHLLQHAAYDECVSLVEPGQKTTCPVCNVPVKRVQVLCPSVGELAKMKTELEAELALAKEAKKALKAKKKEKKAKGAAKK